MANESKRRSAGGGGIGPLTIPPDPDGVISEGDRRHIAGFYSFGSDEEAPPAVSDASIPVFSRVGLRAVVAFLPSVRFI